MTTTDGSQQRKPTGHQCLACLLTVIVRYRAEGSDGCVQKKNAPDRPFLQPLEESEIESVRGAGG